MITQGGAINGSLAAAAGSKPQIAIYDRSNASLGAAWVVPEWESADISVQASETTTVNYEGVIVGVHWTGEFIEASLRLKPFGTTVANALLSSTLISRGYTAVITGMPVIAAGVWTDSFNVSSTTPSFGTLSTYRWHVVADSVSLQNAGSAGKSVTLRRYPGIPGGAAIIS